jgi:CDP-diacylglycerol--inositol 3-phosphatidyltransferase
MPTSHVLAASLYILSGFLDAFDGHAARILNQSMDSKMFTKKLL